MTAPEGWHAFELYDYTAGDGLLTDVVAPVMRAHDAEFFFIRYWAGGPHVRLRVRSGPEAKALRASLEGHAAPYFERVRKPADFDDERFHAAQSAYASAEGVGVPPLVPHGTVRAGGYVPEHTKYGGPEGVAIAEDLFQRSSVLVLELLRGRSPAERSESSILMTVTALRQAGFTPRAMADFLGAYAGRYSHHVTHAGWLGWPDRAERDRPVLADGVRAAGLGRAADHRALTWAAAVRASLDRLAASGAHESADGGAQSVLVNYLHTHNNRLGVLPAEEAYLAWLAASVLAEQDWRFGGQDEAPE